MTDLRKVIDSFVDLRVAVVGDAVVDSYLTGTATRLSREAPIPVSRIDGIRDVPGGAANAAMTVAAMGARTHLLAVVGDDDAGRIAERLLRDGGVHTSGVVVSRGDRTEVKHRLCVDGQMVARYDTGTRDRLSPAARAALAARVHDALAGCDAVVLSDYGSGAIADEVVEALRRHREQRPGLVIVVDAKRPERFRPLRPSAVKPNDQELRSLLPGLPPGPDRVAFVEAHRDHLLDATGALVVAATLDVDGAVVVDRDGPTYRTFARPTARPRACGAGDAYTAVLACALAAGADTATGAELAAAAAHVVTARDGTVACSAALLREHVSTTDDVVVDAGRLARRVAYYRSLGERIVFTNGCFDLLHPGHVSYLSRAKALGDRLVVAINSDASVARLKGASRPINTFRDRATVVAALSSVDHVVEFTGDSPADLIERLRPDVYVKGGDYTVESLPEAPTVRRIGGRIEIVPFVEERSTTSIVERIAARGAGAPAPYPRDRHNAQRIR